MWRPQLLAQVWVAHLRNFPLAQTLDVLFELTDIVSLAIVNSKVFKNFHFPHLPIHSYSSYSPTLYSPFSRSMTNFSSPFTPYWSLFASYLPWNVSKPYLLWNVSNPYLILNVSNQLEIVGTHLQIQSGPIESIGFLVRNNVKRKISE